ncbi:cytosolic carboxypeptidase 3 isoform X3 [Neovison vison]|uniref:cytosolic carboxypeptidase 3 isoform X3 n=1 Tax=Neovison vison TaxID=452646 RepID=UPI001CF0B8F4|nr:cytosolic carboxypeptidase 3 isoform X3 [Neogale vison]
MCVCGFPEAQLLHDSRSARCCASEGSRIRVYAKFSRLGVVVIPGLRLKSLNTGGGVFSVALPTSIIKEISSQTLEEMSEDSEKEDYSDRTISDDESDEDNFMKFVSEDIHQCALLTADSISDPFFPRTTQILLEYQLGRWVPRLREPRDLYGVSSSGPLSPTRWPYHCEVIDEKVQHIDWTPSFPEPVYTPTGLEMEPLYPNSKENTVVYLAEDAYKEPCFVYSRVGGNRTPLKQPADDYNDTLTFEARFESGNLQKVVKVLMEKREVILYCDLHGHSRKENIFMYGCDGSDRCKSLYLQQRIFPLMLSKNCPDKFSFSACKFNVQKSKEGTGRVVMWKMGIRNSFTMEATFCGSTLGNKRGTHFNTKDLESMGYHFCDSLLDYCDPDRTKYYQCLKELEEMEKHINLEKILEDSDTSLKERTLDLDSSSRGSDSSESNESQTYLLKLTSQIKNKKKHLKTKKERNSTIASHQNTREEQEVCDKGHLVQRHRESNSEMKDIKPNVSDDCIFHYFRRSYPNQGLVKIPGRAPAWFLKRYLSSQNRIQRLSKDQQRQLLETGEKTIHEIIQPKSTNLYGNCFKVKSFKCPMSTQTPSWAEKTRIPAEDLRRNFKSKMKECTSFQSKKTGINWTDDEKRIYRDKRIAQTQEILQYLLPIMESTKNVQTPQKKQILNPRTNFQIQHQLKPATYINVKRFSTSWTPPRNHPLISQRNLTVSSLEWLQSVSQRPLENLSPLKVPKKKKKHSGIKATKTKDVKPVSSKWETSPPSFEKDADISKGKSLQAEECNEQNSMQIAPHPAKNQDEQPSKKYGQPAFYLNLQRDK